MGQDYSTEQKAEFVTFRKIIDSAINDTEPFKVFKANVTQLNFAISSNHPFSK